MTKTDLTLRLAKGSPLTHAQHDANFQRLMYWSNVWVSGTTYEANEVVRDGSWTMVANTTTTERPAPQPIGGEFYLYDGANPTVQATAAQLIQGARYDAQGDVFLNGYRVYTVAGNAYRVLSVVDGVFNDLTAFTATETGWVEFEIYQTIIPFGTTFDLIAITVEPDPSPTIVNANYDYDTPNNATAPIAGMIQHSNEELSILRIHKTDNDGGDQSALLAALDVGDIIEGPSVRWSIQSNTDSGTFHTIGVSPATQDSPDGVHSFAFETVTATPITYLKDPNYYAASVTKGLEGIDTAYENIVPDDNAYGVDMLIQSASISSHWDILCVSSGSAGGTSPGGGGEGEANTTSNRPGGVGLAMSKEGIDLPFRSLTSNDATILITNNGDTVDFAALPSGEANTTSNRPGGAGLAKPKIGLDFPFKSITSVDASVTITENVDTVDLSSAGGGNGMPPGGTTGQQLTKNSSTDFDASWADAWPGEGAPYTWTNNHWFRGDFEVESAINITDNTLLLASTNGSLEITETDYSTPGRVVADGFYTSTGDNGFQRNGSTTEFVHSGANHLIFNGTGVNCVLPLTVGAYTLPIVDGSDGQVLTTDGAGSVSWQPGGGGGASVGFGNLKGGAGGVALTTSWEPWMFLNEAIGYTPTNITTSATDGYLRPQIAGIWKVTAITNVTHAATGSVGGVLIYVRNYNATALTAGWEQRIPLGDVDRQCAICYTDVFEVQAAQLNNDYRIEWFTNGLSLQVNWNHRQVIWEYLGPA